MRCDNCKHRKFHSAGSWVAVAEGGDDPYNYEYCDKGHWCGDSTEPQSEEAVGLTDQFAKCPDFKNLNEASDNKPYMAVSGSLPLASGSVTKTREPLPTYHNKCDLCGEIFWTKDAFNNKCPECGREGWQSNDR